MLQLKMTVWVESFAKAGRMSNLTENNFATTTLTITNRLELCRVQFCY